MTASKRLAKFCWYSRLRSIVRKRSNRFAASCSSSPFFTPAHPASATVVTSWPTSSLRSARGTHSSSNTRIGDQMRLRLLKRGNGNFSSDGGKIVKELLQRVTTFDVVDERLNGNTRADKYRGAT